MRIENEYIKLNVTTCGGSMTSIFDKKRNEELLYQKNPDSWQGQDVVIFPFIARLKDGYYTHNKKRYDFKNHGLIRYMIGEDVSNDENKITISFTSDNETLKRFPFQFELLVIYELEDNKIKISYDILNKSEEELPFEVGAHPAFKLPGTKTEKEFDISGNYLKFNQETQLHLMELDDTASFVQGEIDFFETDRIDLNKKLFNDINTIILKSKDFDNSISLFKKDGSKLTVRSNEATFFALWSDKTWGDYVCIEPWTGVPDYENPVREISKKPFIQKIKKGEHYVFTYEIIID